MKIPGKNNMIQRKEETEKLEDSRFSLCLIQKPERFPLGEVKRISSF